MNDRVGPLSRIGHETRLLRVALQYFTRLPMPAFAHFDPVWLSQCVRYFPIVGALVGTVGACVLALCAQVLPMPLAALLALAATLALTGAFHEDGLADTFDALGGHVTPTRALEIMRDSRIGTYGAAALILALLMRWQLTAALPLLPAMATLICAHTAARAGAVGLMAGLPYVRLEDDAKAKPVAQHVRRGHLLAAIALAALPVALCVVAAYFIAPGSFATLATALCIGIVAVVFVSLACARWFRRRLGGYTGDTLGCCEQLNEIAFALAVVATLSLQARLA